MNQVPFKNLLIVNIVAITCFFFVASLSRNLDQSYYWAALTFTFIQLVYLVSIRTSLKAYSAGNEQNELNFFKLLFPQIEIIVLAFFIVTLYNTDGSLAERRELFLNREIESPFYLKLLNIFIIMRFYNNKFSFKYVLIFSSILILSGLLNGNRGLFLYFAAPYLIFFLRFNFLSVIIGVILLFAMMSITGAREAGLGHQFYLYQRSHYLSEEVFTLPISSSFWGIIHYMAAPIVGLRETFLGEITVQSGYAVYNLGFSMPEAQPVFTFIPTMVAPFYSFALSQHIGDTIFLFSILILLIISASRSSRNFEKIVLTQFYIMGLFTIPTDFPFSFGIYLASVFPTIRSVFRPQHESNSNKRGIFRE